ncbi:MAG: alpha/beta fold hydrolase [Deltaproteobacteria bacterium]|nr:alpha/beta fold hydrolase [Deltaproteobacteria bacterium]
MANVEANGMKLEYEAFGDASDPCILLLMGLGGQLVRWPQALVEDLASRGFRVIRYDHRDVGLSEKMDSAGVPNLLEVLQAGEQGKEPDIPYTLADMAADAAGLLDALGIQSACACGVSMGGMIAQRLALNFPQKVSALVSMESTPGGKDLAPPADDAVAALLAVPPNDRKAYVEHMVWVFTVFSGGSPAFDPDHERKMAAVSFDRCFYPPGVARQTAAVLSAPPRAEELSRVAVPALVLHGQRDPLIPPAHGRATADALQNARLSLYEDLGHGLAYPSLWPKMAEEVAQTAKLGLE